LDQRISGSDGKTSAPTEGTPQNGERKTTKQIRDKRKEVAYKMLLQSQSDDTDNSPGSLNDNTQVENLPSQKPMETETTIPFPDTIIGNLPSLEQEGQSPPTYLPTLGNGEPEVPILQDRSWILNTVNQATEMDSTNHDTLGPFQQICLRLISTLKEISASAEFCSQDALDNVYTDLVALILDNAPKTQSEPKRKRRKNNHQNRKRKRYVYARTQELYKHNPSMLAKHIREGTNWLGD
jgi:hypothetical protein